jgi:mRNA interferase MazF
MVAERFDIFWVSLDPTIGSEIRKIRPAVVVSPDEMNRNLNTIIVAPLTSTFKKYPTRIEVSLENRKGQVALDQIRAIDKSRLGEKAGRVDERVCEKICDCLQQMFAK